MSRLVDPTICPDCRANLDATATCTGCGLRVTGTLAVQLWGTMVAADRLVEQLRLASVPVWERTPVAAAPVDPVEEQPFDAPAPPMSPRPDAPAPPMPPRPDGPAPSMPPPDTTLPTRPVRTVGPARRRLPAVSVPVVLLSLGALCLLVAAVVFVAVTWGSLGLAARTLVLLGFTGVLAGVATVLTRKDLRGAAETFWLIVATMLSLDLLAAESAGLAGLDALSWRGTALLVGGILFAMGTGVAIWAQRQPVGTLWGMQGVAVLGALVAAVTNAWLAENPAVGSVVAIPFLLTGAAALSGRLPAVAVALAGMAGLSWLELAFVGLVRATEVSTLGAWWLEFRGWPLLAAAAIAAAGTAKTRLPSALRTVCATAALLLLVVLALAPASPGFESRDSLQASFALAALALVVRVAPLVWAWAAGFLAAAGVVVLGSQILLVSWTSLVELPQDASPDLRMDGLFGGAAPWTYAVTVVVLVLTLAAMLRLSPEADAPLHRNAVLVLGALLVATGFADVLIGLRPPLWAGVVALLVAAMAVGAATFVVCARSAGHVLVTAGGSLATAYLAGMTLFAASPAAFLSAGASTTMAVALAFAFARSERTGGSLWPAVTGSAAVLLLGYALLWWADAADLVPAVTAPALAGYAGAVALIAAPVTRRTTSRLALEIAALVPALAAIGTAPDAESRSLVLTVLATLAAVLAALHRDRWMVAPASVLLAFLATLVRQWDIDITHPELYLLPHALVLVGGGLWHRRRRIDEASEVVLGAGLAVGLLTVAATVGRYPLDLTATLVTTFACLALAVLFAHLEPRPGVVNASASASLAVLMGGAVVVGWCSVLGLTDDTTCLVLASCAALVALTAATLSKRPLSRVAVELSSASVALASLTLATDGATVALALTVTGTSAAILAVLHSDRGPVGWAAVVLLALATAIRLDLEMRAPELYLVPAGVLLLASGLRRLRLDRAVTTQSTLGSGLALGYGLVATLLVDSTDDLLASISATLVLVALVTVFALVERDNSELGGPAAAVLAALSGLTALLTWSEYLRVGDTALNLSLAIYAALIGVIASLVTRRSTSRLALETVAGLLATIAVLTAPSETTMAMVLTVVGTAVAIVSVTNRDRVQAGWLGVVLLGGATVIRVAVDVRAPELYLVPAGVLLLASGLRRLRLDRAVTTQSTLGSGLALGYGLVATLLVDSTDDLLASISATVVLVALVTVFALVERDNSELGGPAAAVLAALSGLTALLTWSEYLRVGDTALSLSLAIYAALIGVIASLVTRRSTSRLALETVAGLLATVAVLTAPSETTMAMVLTVVGTAVAIVSVTNRDRVQAGWLGVVLLGGATVIRVAVDVRAPELYTLPAALMLLAAGVWRLRNDPESGSFAALGSGLTLALLPSLLLALEEPVSLRGALVGAGGVLVLAVGVQRRLGAPFTYGAVTTAILAVRHLEPMTAAAPRWVSLGLLGLALLAVGITWEARLRNLHSARRYLIALR